MKRVRIRHVSLDQVNLGQSILGQPANFTVNWLQTTGTGASESIDLQITDRTDESFRLILDAHYQPLFDNLSAELDFQEIAGGPIANLIGLKPAAPLSLQATASGTQGEWSGQLNAQQESKKLARINYNITRQTNWKAAISGKIVPTPWLKPSLTRVLDDPIRLDPGLTVQHDQLEISV